MNIAQDIEARKKMFLNAPKKISKELDSVLTLVTEPRILAKLTQKDLNMVLSRLSNEIKKTHKESVKKMNKKGN